METLLQSNRTFQNLASRELTNSKDLLFTLVGKMVGYRSPEGDFPRKDNRLLEPTVRPAIGPSGCLTVYIKQQVDRIGIGQNRLQYQLQLIIVQQLHKRVTPARLYLIGRMLLASYRSWPNQSLMRLHGERFDEELPKLNMYNSANCRTNCG
jgi:hypothetical protein